MGCQNFQTCSINIICFQILEYINICSAHRHRTMLDSILHVEVLDGLVVLEMITRSRVRAERENIGTIEKQKRIERKKRFATRDNVVTPYNLRSTMGRKGGTSTKATHSRSKQNVESFEKAEVAPIRLFSLGEEDTSVDNEEIQVCSGYITFNLDLFKFYESPI